RADGLRQAVERVAAFLAEDRQLFAEKDFAGRQGRAGGAGGVSGVGACGGGGGGPIHVGRSGVRKRGEVGRLDRHANDDAAAWPPVWACARPAWLRARWRRGILSGRGLGG